MTSRVGKVDGAPAEGAGSAPARDREELMRGQAMLALGVLSGALLVAAPAQARTPYYQSGSTYTEEDPWCARQKQNRMLLGAALGGVAGAVLGNNVAARNAQTEGTVVGGVVGAASGAAIGRASAQCARTYPSQGYTDPGQTYGYGGAQGVTYGYDEYGLAGAPSRGGGDCRWGSSSTRDPDGREVRESVYMCRGADGVWRRR
jgi:hypothetical protein